MLWARLFLIGLTLFLPLQLQAAVVRIGIDNNPPLTFVNAEGEANGLFPELFTQIAKNDKWTIEYVPCQWDQCLELLSLGEIDILPAIAYTQQRAEEYNFSTETVVISWGQIYRRSDDNLDSILELEGKSCAVLKKDVYYVGTQGLRQIAENFGVTIDFVEVATNQEAFTLLAEGQVDAAMVGRIFGIQNRQKFNLLPTPIMIKPIQVRPAFSQKAPTVLLTEFDRRISTWKQSSTSIYYQLLEKWLGEKTPVKLSNWLRLVVYSLAGILLVLFTITLWTRKQVKIKTLQLANKNQLLEAELTERHKVELALLESQQQYRVFFEESHSVMLLVDPETAGIMDANPAACEFYKYSRDQLKNMKMWQINRLGEAELQQRLAKVKHQKHQQFEFVHTLSDGQNVPVEVYRSPIQVKGRTLLYAIVHDISKRKKAEKALAERSQFLQSVIDGVSDPLMVIGLDYQILQMNQAARMQANGSLSKDGITCHVLSHASQTPCDGQDHPCPFLEVQETGQPVTVIHQHQTVQGERTFELCASPLRDTDGELYAVIEVARDITDRLLIEELLNENEKRLHHMAHHDPLTSLPNRLLFEDRLKQALSKARRSHRQVALFFLDLDNFKMVNDNLGHDFGDLLLIDVARRLGKAVRESDTVARLGGDEFLVLLEEIDSVEMIETMAQRICSVLNHQLTKDHYKQDISASIGISIYPEDASTGHQLMKNADLAMYRAKNIGKAGYQFYSAPQGRFLFD
ncbi:MAG: diguanylate cyclase [Deltaproteobacteria bacterium]|nr:diguanylate cyclase [Deltaproteobacteria bacterium]MCW8893707.1 diguanylate cyclase [Deltaproteobacteria bacterium]MCW9048838.1 diguanylate cyclase [Deltaproteobacteria bacterium]